MKSRNITLSRSGIELIFIPPGRFWQGNNNSEFPDEKPAHRVIIRKRFWISRTCITFESYIKVIGDHPSFHKGPHLPPKILHNNLPMVKVNWYDAIEFCRALSKYENAILRLPSESEWEYACCTGKSEKLGQKKIPGADQIKPQKSQYLPPVGISKPNTWGIFDMVGRVWQWTSSFPVCYTEESNLNTFHLWAPKNNRIVRGGSWITSDNRMFSPSFRGYRHIITCEPDIGFRIALSDE